MIVYDSLLSKLTNLYFISQIIDSKSTIEQRIVHFCDYLIEMR